jgi:hypothetical protein
LLSITFDFFVKPPMLFASTLPLASVNTKSFNSDRDAFFVEAGSGVMNA